MKPRGRGKILKELRRFLGMERDAFDCDGVQDIRVVETNFYALEEELRKLRELVNPVTHTSGGATTGHFRDAADRLALVIHDLKTRSVRPSEYVREKTRNWREAWVFPLLRELERKEEKT